MRKIHAIWFTKFWFQFLVYPTRKVPLTEIGETQESGYPWRIGTCRVFRIPLTRRAVAIGQWTSYQHREMVEGQQTFSMREIRDWRTIVQPTDQDRRAG